VVALGRWGVSCAVPLYLRPSLAAFDCPKLHGARDSAGGAVHIAVWVEVVRRPQQIHFNLVSIFTWVPSEPRYPQSSTYLPTQIV
jgi:hypothetical protein